MKARSTAGDTDEASTEEPASLAGALSRALAARGRVYAATDALGAEVAGVLAGARAAWPGVRLDTAAFLDHLAAQLAREDDVPRALAALQGADLYLAFGCMTGEPRALAELDRHFIAAVPAALGRLATSRDFVEEIQQRLRTKLLVARGDRPAKIADYTGRGPLGGWIRVAAVRTAISARRGSAVALAATPEAADPATPEIGPELQAIRARYRPLFKRAIRGALEGLAPEDKDLLRRHLLEGQSVAEIGLVYRVHGATVSRRVGRARAAVLAETRRVVERELALEQREFESLLVVLRSELDVSLVRVLGGRSD